MTQLILFPDFQDDFTAFMRECAAQSITGGPLVGCRGVGEFSRMEWSDDLAKFYGFPEKIGGGK